jgi:putative ABC transport system permease protein
MTFIFRNLWRRKGRTFLTIFGIVVGIFALTVLGGMSARMNQQVHSMEGLFGGKVSVGPPNQNVRQAMMGAVKYLDLSKARQIEAVPGVKSAAGLVMLPLEESSGFGQPDMLAGYEVEHGVDMMAEVGVKQGRSLRAGDSKKVVLGPVLADKLKATVGGTVDLKGQKYEVVGILNPTLSTTDTFALVSYQDALGALLAENPNFQVKDVAQTIMVLPKQGVDVEALAKTLQKTVPGIKAMSPKDLKKTISQMTSLFNAIILGIAFIALFVGGLSVVNTMIMTVSERTHEIGLKKSIGAKTKAILGEYLLEASMIGFIAGLCGVLLGLLGIFFLNKATQSSGVTIFAVSLTVVIGPVIFATILGAVAGFFPALRAARLSPVDALKEE